MRLGHPLFWTSLVFLCVSCGEKSLAGIGYQKYKDDITNYLISIGGTGNEITYIFCSYAHITGDGTYEAENLKDSIYYRTGWTTIIDGMTNMIDYFVYYASTDRIERLNIDSSAYENAYYLITNGGLSGKIGNL